MIADPARINVATAEAWVRDCNDYGLTDAICRPIGASPVARTLIKCREGDTVTLRTPGGDQELEILEVRYEEIPMAPFQPVETTWRPNQDDAKDDS